MHHCLEMGAGKKFLAPQSYPLQQVGAMPSASDAWAIKFHGHQNKGEYQ